MSEIINFKSKQRDSTFKIKQRKLFEVLTAFTPKQLHEHFNQLYFGSGNKHATLLEKMVQISTDELFREIIEVYSDSEKLIDQLVDEKGDAATIDVTDFLDSTLTFLYWLTGDGVEDLSEYTLTVPYFVVPVDENHTPTTEIRQYKFKRLYNVPYLVDIYCNGTNLASIVCGRIQKLSGITFEDFLQ